MPQQRKKRTPSPHPERTADPCVIVIFGASGDLTQRKLIPALHNLAHAKLLREELAVVGVANDDLSTDSLRDQLEGEIKEFLGNRFDADEWKWLAERLSYIKGDFRDEKAYRRLAGHLDKLAGERGTEGNVLFYCATPPAFFAEIVRQLGNAGLTREEKGHWRRIVVEKPFGHDLESARQLNEEILSVVDEHQIYRIDHYLGKETVQNIMVFRFANSIFEPIWNRRYVDHVQITVAEELGVEHRADYYEDAGALRDMVPSHLFQLLSLIAMEPPNSFEANAVRDEKAKILHAIQPLTPEEVLTRTVRGQYGAGTLADGTEVPAYREESGVDEASRTETFVALKVGIENWRWADVPFYLRTGKRLASRATEIVIQFRRAPFMLFRSTDVERLNPNQLVLRIQPGEGIILRFGAKVPGPSVSIGAVDMDFYYRDYFGASPSTGYETLLYDCMVGDATLFQRADHVRAAWKVVSPILDVWNALPPRTFPNYPSGSWGPEEADALMRRDGRGWRKPS
jgi:glucose-6-phosphate 1-dehydrogenase